MTAILTSRKHVFAINHSPEFLEVLGELLGDEHYLVTTATFGSCTVEDVARINPHLLLVDVAPVDDLGLRFLDQIRQNPLTASVPVVVLSTSPQLINELQDQANVAAWFLRKPTDFDDLLEAITVLIGPANAA